MRRVESALLHAAGVTSDQMEAVLAAAVESVGYAMHPTSSDVRLRLVKTGAAGAVALLDDAGLARRLALALATRVETDVRVFEVVGTEGSKRYRFRTDAFLARKSGELRGAEGVELDLEDPERWSGDLDERVDAVLEEFSDVDARGAVVTFHLRRKPAAKASSSRVAGLLDRLKAAKSHVAERQSDGRYELRIELATGGKQTSYCSADEYEELMRLLGR